MFLKRFVYFGLGLSPFLLLNFPNFFQRKYLIYFSKILWRINMLPMFNSLGFHYLFQSKT